MGWIRRATGARPSGFRLNACNFPAKPHVVVFRCGIRRPTQGETPNEGRRIQEVAADRRRGRADRFRDRKAGADGRDIRVAVKAISANPVDYKVRKRAAPPEGETKILGYDAAGVVDAVGPDVTLFKPGDEVFYAGSIQRQGTNSEFHLVDERIVGPQAEDAFLRRRPRRCR